ncbi:hypothetical protein DFJ74DRAFT_645673 [Hyaloraphidium curvatum]|nr:hypothetical protein DFJ74DRAFT_645673 [Hyaloraphidium curvatum]
MGVSGTLSGGGGALFPRLEAAKQSVRVAALCGPRRARFAGDSAEGSHALDVPQAAGAGLHPFRVAIDASIWMYQTARAPTGRSTPGSTPTPREAAHDPLRTLFYRVLRVLRVGLLPVFVFDNPDPRSRPAHKHGRPHALGKDVLAMQDGFQRLVGLFGMPCLVSRSEAEAECAELSRRGLVDAVLSEDIDTLLFGATALVRGWSAPAGPQGGTVLIDDVDPGDAPPADPSSPAKPDTLDIYPAAAVAEHPDVQLPRRSLILFALLNGSDYTPGVKSLGAMTAFELARDDPAGLGPRLLDAVVAPFERDPAKLRYTPEERAAIQAMLKEHLTSNPEGLLSRKKPAAAANLPADFPPESVLLSYLRPAVHDRYPAQLTDHLARPFSRPVDFARLRAFAAENFGWGHAKLDAKLEKVAEAAGLWEVRRMADAALHAGAGPSGEVELEEGGMVYSSPPPSSQGDARGQAAITDFFGQAKKRAGGEPKDAKPSSSQGSLASSQASSAAQSSQPRAVANPVLEVLRIRKVARPEDDHPGASHEARLLVRLSALPEGDTGPHPWPDPVQVRVPLALARLAAPRMVREWEGMRTPKGRKGGEPGAPRKGKAKMVETRELGNEDGESESPSPAPKRARRAKKGVVVDLDGESDGDGEPMPKRGRKAKQVEVVELDGTSEDEATPAPKRPRKAAAADKTPSPARRKKDAAGARGFSTGRARAAGGGRGGQPVPGRQLRRGGRGGCGETAGEGGVYRPAAWNESWLEGVRFAGHKEAE